MTNVFPAYFMFRKDFDYGKFLEQRSHANEIALRIENETNRIVGHGKIVRSDLEKAVTEVQSEVRSSSDRIERSIDGVAHALGRGFTQISLDLNALNNSVERLDATLFDGFVGLNAALEKTNETLERIAVSLETPNAVWAEEQLSMARRAAQVSMTDIALKHVDLAINGDQSHTGVSIDPRFHFFRGMILSGAVSGPEELNLSQAVAAFKMAARCADKDELLRKEALAKAAWSSYCLGFFDEALMFALETAKIDKHYPLAEFNAAKFLFCKGKIDAARPYLETAVERDPLLALRLDNDEDFSKGREKWLVWLEVVRHDEASRLLAFYKESFAITELDELLALAKEVFETPPSSSPVELSDLIRLREKNLSSLDMTSTLAEIKQHMNRLPELESEVRESVARLITFLESGTSNLREQGTPRLSSLPDEDHVVPKLRNNTTYGFEAHLPLLGCLAGVLLGVIIAAEEWNVGDPFALLGSLLAFFLATPVLSGIGLVLGKLIKSMVYEFRVARAKPAALEKHRIELSAVKERNEREKLRADQFMRIASRAEEQLPRLQEKFKPLLDEKLAFQSWLQRV